MSEVRQDEKTKPFKIGHGLEKSQSAFSDRHIITAYRREKQGSYCGPGIRISYFFFFFVHAAFQSGDKLKDLEVFIGLTSNSSYYYLYLTGEEPGGDNTGSLPLQ